MKVDQHLYRVFRDYIYKEGRLIERRMFDMLFGEGTPEGFLSALRAYMNADGGFGHGLEPDLRTPVSTAIAAETALCMLDIAEVHDGEVIRELAHWVNRHLNQNGWISHPVNDIKDYPHQPWWLSPDDTRILAIAGLLKKLGVQEILDEDRIEQYAMTVPLPEKVEMYSYPLFVYALYHHDFKRRDEVINHFVNAMPEFLKTHIQYHPIFTRYWHYMIELLPEKVVEAEAWRVVDAFTNEGHLPNPYEELPWWTPILTLDAAVLLKKYEMLTVEGLTL